MEYGTIHVLENAEFGGEFLRNEVFDPKQQQPQHNHHNHHQETKLVKINNEVFFLPQGTHFHTCPEGNVLIAPSAGS